MKPIQNAALAVMAVVYIALLIDKILKHRKGMLIESIRKKNRSRKTLVTEIGMKFSAFSVIFAEIICVILDLRMWRSVYAWVGIGMAMFGTLFLITAMIAMRYDRRKADPKEILPNLQRRGISRISRTFAILGLGLVYLGLLVGFFNYLHLIVVLVAFCLLSLRIMREKRCFTVPFGENDIGCQKDRKTIAFFNRSKKKAVTSILSIVLCIACILGGLAVRGMEQQRKLPELTFAEALSYTTKRNPDAVITVGMIKDGQISYQVYGNGGKKLPNELHTYEIGSLTKTVTAALIVRAITEEKLDPECTIDAYLALPKGNSYPTVNELLTHTSGYEGYYFESPMILNFLVGKNSFCGVTEEMLLDKVGKLSMDRETYDFRYSNFGYAVLGLVLEAVYHTDYTTLANDFLQNGLGLTNTKISTEDGDLGNDWHWNADDAYLSAGGITSNIADMLLYAQMQLENAPYFAECHESTKTIDAASAFYESMGIRMDEIGLSWIIDRENGIVWHNGGTGYYNSYLGFHAETGTAVVVLSNLSPGDRIPATVLGIKLLSELIR